MATSKATTLVVTETHRIKFDDAVVAEMLAAFIEDTGRCVAPGGIGIYDFDNIETTISATTE